MAAGCEEAALADEVVLTLCGKPGLGLAWWRAVGWCPVVEGSGRGVIYSWRRRPRITLANLLAARKWEVVEVLEAVEAESEAGSCAPHADSATTGMPSAWQWRAPSLLY